jgi:hypothetical protein
MFKNEVPAHNLVERNIPNFSFNFLAYEEETFASKNFIFSPTITNFYITDMISQNSSTMGECALFLNENSNF